jgi:hypothetical protein
MRRKLAAAATFTIMLGIVGVRADDGFPPGMSNANVLFVYKTGTTDPSSPAVPAAYTCSSNKYQTRTAQQIVLIQNRSTDNLELYRIDRSGVVREHKVIGFADKCFLRGAGQWNTASNPNYAIVERWWSPSAQGVGVPEMNGMSSSGNELRRYLPRDTAARSQTIWAIYSMTNPHGSQTNQAFVVGRSVTVQISPVWSRICGGVGIPCF